MFAATNALSLVLLIAAKKRPTSFNYEANVGVKLEARVLVEPSLYLRWLVCGRVVERAMNESW